MSYHAIENLVEDAVNLVGNTELSIPEQRTLIYNLYQFQNKFDTSYTVLRCFTLLERIGFIEKLPMEQHPDFKKYSEYFKTLEDSGWLYADVEQKDELDSVYFQDGFILIEYGSDLWKRLNTDGQPGPDKIPLLNLIARIIEICIANNDTLLAKNFYVAFIDAFLDFDLTEEEGIPKSFEEWLSQPDLIKIRELFIQNSLLSIKKKETEFEIPSRTEALSGVTDPNQKAKVEFFMDAKKSIEQITKNFQKGQKALAEIGQKIEVISGFLKTELDAQDWTFIKQEEDPNLYFVKWFWYKDVEQEGTKNRLFTEFFFDIRYSSMYIKQYVQHDLLLQWQEKDVSLNVKDAHFEVNPFEFLDNDDYQKHLDDFGFWKLPITSKENTILKSIALLLEFFSQVGNRYLDTINKEYPIAFFFKPYQSYIDIFESDKPITDFLLIDNLYSISMLFIYNLAADGKIKEALAINDIQESRLTDRFRNNVPWYKASYLPFIQAIKNGDKPKLPAMFSKY